MTLKPKFVFFDIDGTLLDEHKNLPQSTIRAIKQLRQNGVHIAIATGRAPFMYEKLRKQLEIDVFVSFNGQYVVDKEQVVYKRFITQSDLKDLENQTMQQGHAMVFMNHQAMSVNQQDHPFVVESMNSLKIEMPSYDPTYYHDKEIYQALIFCTEQEEKHYRDAYQQMQFIRWHEKSMDVLPTIGSKALGIQTLLKQWGASMDQVCAFGDATNDIEMLTEVGTGIAMGNASEQVKSIADWVTKPVHEDGIEFGLKKLGLI